MSLRVEHHFQGNFVIPVQLQLQKKDNLLIFFFFGRRERSEGSPLQSQVQVVLEDSQRPHQSLNDHKTQLRSPKSPQINLFVELYATSKLSEHQIFLIEAKEIERWIAFKEHDLKEIEQAKKIKGVEEIRHQL